jgi:hypothetical protein
MKGRVLPVIRWLHVAITIHFLHFAAKFQQIPFRKTCKRKISFLQISIKIKRTACKTAKSATHFS